MPQIQIRPSRKYLNDTTLLTENLQVSNIDTTETVLSGTPVNERASTQKYLEIMGVAQLDEQFNNAIAKYEEQFKLQATELQMQANIAEQDTMMQTGESIFGKLGTGAAADLSGDISREQAKQTQSAQLELTENFADTLTELESVYQKQVQDMLGDLTPEGYSNIVAFGEMAQGFSTALLEHLATSVGLSFSNDDEMFDALIASGYLEQSGDTAEYELTEAGLIQFKSLLISYDSRYGSEVLSERMDAIIDTWTERYMSENYPMLSPEDSSYETKRFAIEQEFNEWLAQNQPALYYAYLDMAKYSDGKIEYEGIHYNTDVYLPDGSTRVDVLTSSWFGEFSGSDNSNSEQTKFIDKLISDLKTGIVPDNTYIIANIGNSKEDNSLYYYENGVLSKTEYTLNNLPDEFSASAFYNLADSGTFWSGINVFEADNYVRATIKAANTGKLKSKMYTISGKTYYYDAETNTFKRDYYGWIGGR